MMNPPAGSEQQIAALARQMDVTRQATLPRRREVQHDCGHEFSSAALNVTLEFLPPCSPELNPQENIWDEIREKILKTYALKSMDKVCDKLEEAALYIERNPDGQIHHILSIYRPFNVVSKWYYLITASTQLRRATCRSGRSVLAPTAFPKGFPAQYGARCAEMRWAATYGVDGNSLIG
jgi:hypothetical protein